MTLIQTDVQNKESRENKFLSDKIIQKVINSGEITKDSVPEVTELFQEVFLKHKEDTARVRAEAMMLVLREYIINKREEKIKEPEVVGIDVDKQVNQIVENDDGEDEEEREEKERQRIYEEEKQFLQKIINEKVASSSLSEKLHEKVRQFIFDETSHIIGTSVGERILLLSVTKAFDEFKQKNEPQEEKIKEPEVKLEEKKEAIKKGSEAEIAEDVEKNEETSTSVIKIVDKDIEAEDVKDKEKEEEEKNKEAKKSEEVEDTSDAVTQDSAQDPTSAQVPQDDEEEKAKPTKKKKLSFKESVLQKAREDDINNPLKPNTLHWPTSTVSIGEPVKKNETKEELSKIIEGKKVDEKQKESLNHMNFIKPIGSMNSSEESIEPMESVKNSEIIKPIEPKKSEMTQSLSPQNKVNFDKFINDQIGTIMEVIKQNNIVDGNKFNEIQDGLNKQALDIAKNTQTSMSERAQLLNTFFQEQKKLYVVKKVEKVSNSKSMIDEIIKLSEREINTGNMEADNRFRTTLRNSLSSKASSFTESEEDADLIKEALDEEYLKHKSFYIKNK